MSKEKKKRNTTPGNDATLKEYQGFVKTSYKVFQLDTVLQCARQKLDNWDGRHIAGERERFYALFELSRTLTEMVDSNLKEYGQARFDFMAPDGER